MVEKRTDLVRFCEKQKDRVKDHYQGILFAVETKFREQMEQLTDLESRVVKFYEDK